MTNVNRKSFLLYFLGFISFLALYYLWRSNLPYVWDDTNVVKIFHLVDSANNWHHYNSLIRLFIDSFSNDEPRGYRPLASFIRHFNILLKPDLVPSSFLILVSGTLISTFNIYLYLLLKKINLSKLTILLSIFFINLSPIFLQANWIMIAGFPILIPLCNVACIYYYLSIRENFKSKNVILFLIFFLISLYYREFTFVLALTLLAFEIVNIKNDLRLYYLTTSFFLFLLSIFPTILPKLIFLLLSPALYLYNSRIHNEFTELPIKSIFQMGNASDQIIIFSNYFQQFVPMIKVNAHFIMMFPILFCIGYLSIITYYQSIKIKLLTENQSLFNIIFFLAVFIFYFNFSSLGIELFGIFVILVTIINCAFNRKLWLIIIWFVLSYLPLLIVFTEKVHLIYSMIPFAILLIYSFIQNLYLLNAQKDN